MLFSLDDHRDKETETTPVHMRAPGNPEIQSSINITPILKRESFGGEMYFDHLHW